MHALKSSLWSQKAKGRMRPSDRHVAIQSCGWLWVRSIVNDASMLAESREQDGHFLVA